MRQRGGWCCPITCVLGFADTVAHTPTNGIIIACACVLQGECAEVDNKQDCQSKTIKLVNKGKYAQWAMPVRNLAECQVPSVSGMLGRTTSVAKEGAARLEMLTMMGAETEKQAAAVAAATAAEDAAKAGRILAERGVTGLQQLYARASTVLG